MTGDRSFQGKREIRADIHERFEKIRAKAEAEATGILSTYKTLEAQLPKRGDGQRLADWRAASFFIEEPDAVVSTPVDIGFYQDEVSAG